MKSKTWTTLKPYLINYCFQNPGNKIVSTVKISKRPTIIRKDKNHFDTAGTSA